MHTGPRAEEGFDLALTELLEPHRFVVEVGSERGEQLLARLPHGEARQLAERAIRNHDPCISCSTHSLTLRLTRT